MCFPAVLSRSVWPRSCGSKCRVCFAPRCRSSPGNPRLRTSCTAAGRGTLPGHHPALAQSVKPAWHFTIGALVRCEIQAIDQHWSLHQLALAWPGGEADDGLAREIAFLGDEPLPQGLSWPTPEPSAIGALIERHLRQHIDLDPIRKRQERYLGRELARVDAYFLQYRRELEARGVRAGKQARLRSGSPPQKKSICDAATTRSTVTRFPSLRIWMPFSGSPNLPGGHTFAGPKVAKGARRHGITYRACAGGCRLQKRGAIDQGLNVERHDIHLT